MSALKVALVPRLCVAVLTSVILSGAAGMLLISAYQGFHVNFLILFTYITPAVMLVGLPVSILMDAVLQQWKIRHPVLRLFAGAVLYAGAGFVGTCLYMLILTGAIFSGQGWLSLADSDFYRGIRPFTRIGVTSALLFYTLHQLLHPILSRMKI